MKPYWFAALAVSIFLVIGASAWPVANKQLTANENIKVDANGYSKGMIYFSNQAIQVQVPMTTATQQQGLAGRTNLSDGEGMLWIFNKPDRPTFWMKGMKIDLDFIWLKDNQIVEIMANVTSPKTVDDLPLYQPSVPVNAVLEVAAGFVGRHSINVGDVIRIDIAKGSS
jgi:uncharacterized membrane protein (UPF0127 family)